MTVNLPNNWVETTLGDIATVQSGGTPSRSNKLYWDGDIPWVKISDIDNWYVKETKELITKSGLENSSTKIFPKGTILFTIFATIGKVGVLDIDATTNQAIAGITPIDLVNHRFITYSLLELVQELQKQGKGVAQKNINLTILKALNVPLPPLPEQKRIVAKLDGLFAHFEEVKTRLDKIPQLLKDFRQQVLTQAVTGKLTKEWREGKELLEVKIESIINNSYSHVQVPKVWVNTIIEKIGLVKGGKRLPKGHKLVSENTGRPYIRARDLKEGTVLTTNMMFLLPETQAQINRYIVNKLDLYITIVGAKIGDAGIIPETMHGANLTENAAKITEVDSHVNPNYMALWLRGSICQNNIQDTIMSAAQGKLALTRIKQLPVYIPPSEEQTEIVSRVETLFLTVDEIEEKYNYLKQKTENLPQAVLQKAFNGELVEQLTSDGDARELLREIEALKADVKPINRSEK